MLINEPPPSDSHLRSMVAAGWWYSIDGQFRDIEHAPKEYDPLYRTASNTTQSPMLGLLVQRIAERRLDILFEAAEPLFEAVEAGVTEVSVLDGITRFELSAEVIRLRSWRFGRDGAFRIPRADGADLLFRDAKLVPPTAAGSAFGSQSDVARPLTEEQHVPDLRCTTSDKPEPAKRRVFSLSELEKDYQKHVEEWKGEPLDEGRDWKHVKAMRNGKYAGVARATFKAVRDEFAPQSWKRGRGRPRSENPR